MSWSPKRKKWKNVILILNLNCTAVGLTIAVILLQTWGQILNQIKIENFKDLQIKLWCTTSIFMSTKKRIKIISIFFYFHVNKKEKKNNFKFGSIDVFVRVDPRNYQMTLLIYFTNSFITADIFWLISITEISLQIKTFSKWNKSCLKQ